MSETHHSGLLCCVGFCFSSVLRRRKKAREQLGSSVLVFVARRSAGDSVRSRWQRVNLNIWMAFGKSRGIGVSRSKKSKVCLT